MEEVVSMIRKAGFEVVKAYYSTVNDLSYIDAELEEYLKITSYKDLLRITIKRPTKLNILRTLAYPLIRLRPTLSQLIVIVGRKVKEPYTGAVERW